MAEARITDHDFLFPLAAVNLQLGSHWKDPPGGFTKTWAYIMEGEYGKAADEAGKSKWIQQTAVRVKQFQDALHALAQKKE